MITQHTESGLFCISFDSVSVSGIIVELLKIAKIFHANNYHVYLDLGYEIKADKKNFFIQYTDEKEIFPDWVHLVKTIDQPFYQYSEDLVTKIFDEVINKTVVSNKYEVLIENYKNYVAEKFIKLWSKLNIKYILVENGTLPENIIFTKALYRAIEIYGNQNHFKKYVIWRDHDLMWSSEANTNKYGNFPYPNLPTISRSNFISYVVLHDADYNEMLRWMPNLSLSILRNNFQLNDLKNSKILCNQFRKLHNIPENSFLIARFTRIIPQKRIDRDIHLVNLLHRIATSEKSNIKIYLVIAGNINENVEEYLRLQTLISLFNLKKYVLFIGNLAPLGFELSSKKHLKDLILASDLCSFMTSYHYDSFGNPIAEAISLGKPYITTSYKRYQHVYGDLGYQGLIFNISESDDGQIDECYAKKVYDFLHNDAEKKSIINTNIFIMNKYLDTDSMLIHKLNKLLDISLIRE